MAIVLYLLTLNAGKKSLNNNLILKIINQKFKLEDLELLSYVRQKNLIIPEPEDLGIKNSVKQIIWILANNTEPA